VLQAVEELVCRSMINTSMKRKQQTSQVTMSPQQSTQHNLSADISYFTHERSSPRMISDVRIKVLS